MSKILLNLDGWEKFVEVSDDAIMSGFVKIAIFPPLSIDYKKHSIETVTFAYTGRVTNCGNRIFKRVE
jgi:hypothetical protein